MQTSKEYFRNSTWVYKESQQIAAVTCVCIKQSFGTFADKGQHELFPSLQLCQRSRWALVCKWITVVTIVTTIELLFTKANRNESQCDTAKCAVHTHTQQNHWSVTRKLIKEHGKSMTKVSWPREKRFPTWSKLVNLTSFQYHRAVSPFWIQKCHLGQHPLLHAMSIGQTDGK